MRIIIRMIRKISIMLGLIILFSGFISVADAQNRSRLKLSFKDDGEKIHLNSSILIRINRRYLPVEDLNIRFYYLEDTSKIEIGEALTDETGNAEVSLPRDVISDHANADYHNFLAEFEGNDTIKPSDKDISVKEVRLDMQFSKKDEQTVIVVNGTEILGGEEVPLDGVLASILVPRTFTSLKVDDAEFIDGVLSIPFPTYLPGDSLGYLTIIARIDKNEDYGTVETHDRINWGKPVPPMKPAHRGLGDTNAPLWMVYTLIVLLSLVWFHYLYVIFSIYKINREGKKYLLTQQEK